MPEGKTHEMRYEAGSSRYRLLTLYVQDEKQERPGYTVRTLQMPKGNMDTEKFLKMFGVNLDLFSGAQNERWYRDQTKEQALAIVKRWRTSCQRTGLDKILKFTAQFQVINS